MQGWIKWHRQVMDHWLYLEKRTFSRYEAWLDLVMLANSRDQQALIGGELVTVERGTFITSELKLMERWRWSKSKLRQFLKLLEDEGMIEKVTTKKWTAIKIRNYEAFQETEVHEQAEDEPPAEPEQKKRKSPSRKKPAAYPEDSTYYRMASYFHNKISEMAKAEGFNHASIAKADLQKWADEFRKLVEIDGVKDKRLIRDVIDWVTADSFWRVNILSVKKLREKFPDLVLRMKSQSARGTGPPHEQPKKSERSMIDRLAAAQEWIEAGGDPYDFDPDN